MLSSGFSLLRRPHPDDDRKARSWPRLKHDLFTRLHRVRDQVKGAETLKQRMASDPVRENANESACVAAMERIDASRSATSSAACRGWYACRVSSSAGARKNLPGHALTRRLEPSAQRAEFSRTPQEHGSGGRTLAELCAAPPRRAQTSAALSRQGSLLATSVPWAVPI